MKLLLVEDDETLRLALTTSLENAGYIVDTASDAAGAIERADAGTPDVVVLDLGLPDADGRTVLDRLRSQSDIPVLVLTARHDRTDKIALLQAGADDYVTKPFDTAEVLARLGTILRRTGRRRRAFVVDVDLVIDLDQASVRRAGAELSLTPTEVRLLGALVSAGDRVVPHDELLRSVWGEAYGTESEYLRTFVAQLRRKLGDDATRPRLIRTHPGIGYRWIGDIAQDG